MTSLTAPNLIARRVTAVALVACAVAVAILVTGGGSSYTLNLALGNASGLRPGSQVLLGGVPVGTVGALDVHGNVVLARLKLNPAQVRVGTGASASITAANLLGEDYVALNAGNRDAPLPSGSTLPESATAVPTDLDQIIDVLDAPTRGALAVLLRESGIAVAGRKADVSAILHQMPLSFTAATQLLDQVVGDNHSLADAIANSDGFISRINQQSGSLDQAIAATSRATAVLARNAGSLQASVAGGAPAVTTLTNVLNQAAPVLKGLVAPAGEIADAAPSVDELLAAAGPFTREAVPTLNRAAAVAPTLTRLAVQATPTVNATLPMLGALQNIARLAQPLSTWLGLSSQDLFNILAGWSRAVQFRDGIGHIFNGDFYLNPKLVLNVANRGASAQQRCQNLLDVLGHGLLQAMGEVRAADTARQHGCAARKAAPAPARRRQPNSLPAVHLKGIPTPSNPVKRVTSSVAATVNGALGRLGATVKQVLGATNSTVKQVLGGSGSSGSLSTPLKNLLSYLLKP